MSSTEPEPDDMPDEEWLAFLEEYAWAAADPELEP